MGSGANYDQAYFEIQYVRAYTTGAPVPTSTGGQALATDTSSSTSSSPASLTSFPATSSDPNGVTRSYGLSMGYLHVLVLVLLGVVLGSATTRTFTDVW